MSVIADCNSYSRILVYIAVVKLFASLLLMVALCLPIKASDEQRITVNSNSVDEGLVSVAATGPNGKVINLMCFDKTSSCSVPKPGEYLMLPAGVEGVYEDCTNVLLYNSSTGRIGVYCWENSGDCYIFTCSAEKVEVVPSAIPEVPLEPRKTQADVLAAAQEAPRHEAEFQLEGSEWQKLDKPLKAYKQIRAADQAAVVQVLTPEFADYPNPPTPTERASETLVKSIDLNGDGVPEVVAQTIGDACSPTGNCSVYVLQKVGTKYRVILSNGVAQTIKIQKTRTNGYRDVVVGSHGSATEHGLLVYQFSEGQYRPTHCYIASFSCTDKNGEVHELEEARIMPCRK